MPAIESPIVFWLALRPAVKKTLHLESELSGVWKQKLVATLASRLAVGEGAKALSGEEFFVASRS